MFGFTCLNDLSDRSVATVDGRTGIFKLINTFAKSYYNFQLLTDD